MDIDASVRLARLGIAVPRLQTLGRQGFPAFESEGGEALDWWRRLRAVSDRSGWWPVLLDQHAGALASNTSNTSCDAGDPAPPGDPALTGNPAAPGDPALTGNPAAPGDPALIDESPLIDDPAPETLEKELEHWPASGEVERIDRFHLPFERWTREPEPVWVALLPAAHGWEVPRLIGYGGWNRCPAPRVHAAILKRWQERFGAELVCLTRTGLELGLTLPPRTRTQALALAWDYASYCYDGIDAIYQADTLAGLAAGLVGATVVRCWWD